MNKQNPFNPNSIVNPTLFAGRAEQISNILNKLKQVKSGMPVSFVLHGDKGIGKTALAKLIKYMVSRETSKSEKLLFTTSYYATGKDQSIQSVLESSLNALTDQLDKTVIDTFGKTLGNLFQNGKFTFGGFGYNYENKEKELQSLKDHIVSILTNIIKKNENSNGILIIIDEIHNLSNLKGAAQVLRAVSTTLDVNNYGNISFMLLGYTDSVQSFFEGDPSSQRHFDSLPLTSMSTKESLEVLTKGFDHLQLKYNKDEVGNCVEKTAGYPHSIQLLGHNIISEYKDNNIDTQDLTNATAKTALELRSKSFSSFYNFEGKATLREILLDILAFSKTPITKKKAQELCGKNKNIYQKSVLPLLLKRI